MPALGVGSEAKRRSQRLLEWSLHYRAHDRGEDISRQGSKMISDRRGALGAASCQVTDLAVIFLKEVQLHGATHLAVALSNLSGTIIDVSLLSNRA